MDKKYWQCPQCGSKYYNYKITDDTIEFRFCKKKFNMYDNELPKTVIEQVNKIVLEERQKTLFYLFVYELIIYLITLLIILVKASLGILHVNKENNIVFWLTLIITGICLVINVILTYKEYKNNK